MHSQSRVFQILIGAIILVFVVSLYAGVAMPSFRKGQQSHCSSNIHQLALAMQMYSSDNDSLLPPPPYSKRDSWPRVLRSYALSDEAQKHHRGEVTDDVSSVAPYICPARADRGYGFGMNYYAAGRMCDGNADPSQVILLAEAKEVSDTDWWVSDDRFTPSAWTAPYSHYLLSNAHASGANIAFLDGHVRATKLDQLTLESWAVY